MNRRSVAVVAVIIGTIVVFILALPIAVAPRVKERLLAAVGDRFDSAVEVETLRVSLLPRPRVSGSGMVLRHKNRTDVPPLIKIASFSAEASLFGLTGRPLRLSRLHLVGLEINVPPGGMDIDGSDERRPDGNRRDAPDATSASQTGRSPIVIADLLSEHAVLRIIRRKPGKPPRVFDIRHLVLRDVGADVPWPFRAELTNPKPPGEIQTHGTFGPWNAGDPSKTALAAEYRFSGANLGVFDGIEGILSSSGAFKGVLERIDVDGRASVPEFALSDVKQPVRLETSFHSVVDGTSGDTLLEPVDGSFLNTRIHTSGGVVEREGEQGRTVTLNVVMDDARIEDVIHLAVKSPQPAMIGALKVRAALVLPPGPRDVIQKLRLDGTFDVASARFTKAGVQAKVDEFSSKARGERDDSPDPVVSNLNGRFRMRDGVIHFSNVRFAMPGAHVDVAGRFIIQSKSLDFRGTVHLNAKLSKLTTGVKAFFLKLIDGLLRHDDVTVIPITVSGTASHPKVKLDIGKVFKSD